MAPASPGFLDAGRGARRDRQPGLPRRRLGRATAAPWCTRRGWPASWPGSPPTSASRSTRHPGHRPRRAHARAGRRAHHRRSVTADRVALATNVFPSLLRRTRMLTVPVYDYVLMTEPLIGRAAGVDRLGAPAGARRPGQPVPLLPADRRQPDPLGRVRRDLPDRRPGARRRTRRGRRRSRARLALPRGLPAAGGADLQPPLGGRDRHLHAVRARSTGWRSRGRVAYAAGFTGLGVGATRFAAEVMLDRLSGLTTERTRLEMVRRKPLPFPPEPLRVRRHQRRPAGRSTAPTTVRGGATSS